MLANSNQDFSVYIKMLFQGAHNLFVTRIKPSEHVRMLARADSLGIKAELDEADSDSSISDQDSDVEAQLESFMAQALQDSQNPASRQKKSFDDFKMILEKPRDVAMPELNVFGDKNDFDPVFQIDKGARPFKKRKEAEVADSVRKSVHTSEIESVSLEESDKSLEAPRDPKMSMTQSDDSEGEDGVDELVKLQQRFVLGMVSSNRELFLFDRQVKISRHVEGWLTNVEDSMRLSVKKHMKNAILRFATQPIEEWIGDYPQQVAISVIHLIVSQEITDTLSNVDFDAPDIQNQESHGLFHEEKVTVGRPDPALARALANDASGMTARSKDSSNSKGERDSQEKESQKNGGPRDKVPEIDDYKADKLQSSISNEPPLEPGEEDANFLDDAFGENAAVEYYLDQGYLAMRAQENRMNAKSFQAKIKSLKMTKKPEYKEDVLNCL